MVCVCCPKCNSILGSTENGWSCKYCETSFDGHMKELGTYIPVEELEYKVYSETSVTKYDRNSKLS